MATKVEQPPSAATAPASTSGGPSSVDVRWEDQQAICEFGRLAARRHELAAALAGKRRASEDAAEAAGELLALSEDEEDEDPEKEEGGKDGKGAAVRLLEGECFVHYNREGAEARLGELEAEAAAAEKEAARELAAVDARMDALKVRLYARLGRANINLEE